MAEVRLLGTLAKSLMESLLKARNVCSQQREAVVGWICEALCSYWRGTLLRCLSHSKILVHACIAVS